MKTHIGIKRREPLLGEAPDYSRAFYPDPPSHDFCVWLIGAEMTRRLHRARGPLKVKLGLKEGQLGRVEYGSTGVRAQNPNPCDLSLEYYREMLFGVMGPAAGMLGAQFELPCNAPFDFQGLQKYCEYDYHLSGLVDASRAGARVPVWIPPRRAHEIVEGYLKGRRPIVLTLREVEAQPERNSSLVDWVNFAHLLRRRRYDVLVVRDTQCADAPLDDLETWPLASKDAYIRAALYEHATLNMQVCNGPNVWVMFSRSPYLIFKQLVPQLGGWEHGQAKGWREQDHLEVGEQLPWRVEGQELAWMGDTFGELCEGFGRWEWARRKGAKARPRVIGEGKVRPP